jgi:hypothetical protein
VEGVPTAAFVQSEDKVEIVANFGVLAAREVSREEVDRLADALLGIVQSVTVFTGRRYEFTTGAAEVAGSEVRVWFPPHTLPDDDAEREAMLERVLAEVDAWARASAARPPPDGEDLASRIIRGPSDQ